MNTLLQCLEDFGDNSVFVAATNLENELDRAIWRRFDTKMIYSLPDESSRRQYIELLINGFNGEVGVTEEACKQLSGCSFADIEQIVLKAKRKAIIERTPLKRDHIILSCKEYNPSIN